MEVQRSLHMKFEFHLLKSNSMWADFFRAKYLKDIHIMQYVQRPSDSIWRSILSTVPEVMDNVQVRMRVGNSSFWYDHWLASGPLSVGVTEI